MVEEIKRRLQKAMGITDEDFEGFISFPNNVQIMKLFPEIVKYKIIAEVTESKYCFAGLKPGQKYTISGMPAMLLSEESDCPLCVRAIGPIANLVAGFWDRIIAGADPNQGMWQTAACLDPGTGRGGLGHVVFRVYARKMD